MGDPEKSSDQRVPEGALHAGLREEDDWSVARDRLADYRRTGEIASVEEFFEALSRLVDLERARRLALPYR